MRTIALIAALLAHCSPARAAEPFSLRLITADGTINCLPDGSARVERPAAAQGKVILNLTHSPDARHAAFARDAVIYVGDANAEHAVRVSPEGLETAWPTWSPDGRRIAFLARRGGNVYQVHVVNRDGDALLNRIRRWHSAACRRRSS